MAEGGVLLNALQSDSSADIGELLQSGLIAQGGPNTVSVAKSMLGSLTLASMKIIGTGIFNHTIQYTEFDSLSATQYTVTFVISENVDAVFDISNSSHGYLINGDTWGPTSVLGMVYGNGTTNTDWGRINQKYVLENRTLRVEYQSLYTGKVNGPYSPSPVRPIFYNRYNPNFKTGFLYLFSAGA